MACNAAGSSNGRTSASGADGWWFESTPGSQKMENTGFMVFSIFCLIGFVDSKRAERRAGEEKLRNPARYIMGSGSEESRVSEPESTGRGDESTW